LHDRWYLENCSFENLNYATGNLESSPLKVKEVTVVVKCSYKNLTNKENAL